MHRVAESSLLTPLTAVSLKGEIKYDHVRFVSERLNTIDLIKRKYGNQSRGKRKRKHCCCCCWAVGAGGRINESNSTGCYIPIDETAVLLHEYLDTARVFPIPRMGLIRLDGWSTSCEQSAGVIRVSTTSVHYRTMR